MAVVADAISGLLLVALVAVLVAHPNTASDVNAVGGQFNSALSTATKGGS